MMRLLEQVIGLLRFDLERETLVGMSCIAALMTSF